MPCYYPLHGFRAKLTNPSGKRGIVFKKEAGYSDRPVTLPCGRCVGCRLEKSRQWAMRCMHESELHEENSFITLTYDDEHLPRNGSLVKEHYQKFMKRLRFKHRPKKIKYYQCGEYGDDNGRPHYHALLFGHDFRDKTYLKTTKAGHPLFTSAELLSLWGMGHCYIGAVTFDSAAYVARYVMKKVNGDDAEHHYRNLNPKTGETNSILPEYSNMSRRPGIGTEWYKQYKSEVFPDDFVIVNGQKIKPPRFYIQKLEKEEPKLHAQIKRARVEQSAKNQWNQTTERLIVREKVTEARLNMKKRPT